MRSVLPILLFLPWAATAQTEGEVEASVSAGWSTFRGGILGQTKLPVFPDVVLLDARMKDGFRAGASLTLNTWRHFGHEVSYGYQRSRLLFRVSPSDPNANVATGTAEGRGFGVHTVYYDFLAYATAPEARVRPYISGGLGVSQAQNERYFGFGMGGGLKIRLNNRNGIRFDARDRITDKFKDFQISHAPGLWHTVQYSAGFSLLL